MLSVSDAIYPHRRRRLGRGISRRLTLAVVLFSSAITVFTTAIQLYFDYTRDIERINSQIAQIKFSYFPALSESLWALDDDQLDIQLVGLTKLPDIEYVAIEVDGKSKWTSGNRRSRNVIAERIPFIQEYKGKKENFGTLYIVASVDNVYWRLINKGFVILLTNGFKTFLVAGFIVFLVHYLFVRHIEDLAEFARTIRFAEMGFPFSFRRRRRNEEATDELDDR